MYRAPQAHEYKKRARYMNAGPRSGRSERSSPASSLQFRQGQYNIKTTRPQGDHLVLMQVLRQLMPRKKKDRNALGAPHPSVIRSYGHMPLDRVDRPHLMPRGFFIDSCQRG